MVEKMEQLVKLNLIFYAHHITRKTEKDLATYGDKDAFIMSSAADFPPDFDDLSI